MSLIIFGATGDLVKSKVVPALNSLGANFLLYGRKDIQAENYIKGELSEIKEKLNGLGITHAYIALPPIYYELVIKELSEVNGLDHIAIEKPFGSSFSDAEKLVDLIHELKIENKIYLVDHYLGKSEMIKLLDMDTEERKKMFDSDIIDHVELDAIETNDVDSRGAFYDHVGTIKDYVESHVLAVIANLLMQQGCEVSSTECRQKVLEKINFKLGSLKTAQYEGFRNVLGVDTNSNTETAVSLDFIYDNNFPITVNVGKALDRAEVSLNIYYKNGDKKEININSSKENSYEEILNDFLNNHKKFSLSYDEATLCWKITEEILKEKVGKTPSIYKKGSDIINIWK